MTALRIRFVRSVSMLAACMLLASCDILGLTIGGSGQRAELRRQQAKWARQQITSYYLTYRRDCFCGIEFTTPLEIEVIGGDIATARYTSNNDPIPTWVQSDLPTVERLFGIIARAIDAEADLLEVTYDPDRGYPRRIAIDYRYNLADDEVTHSVSSLQIILPPVVP
jgi:hypothetical protein